MYEGKPLVLVIGSTDTGRTPMAAALLRRALGPDVVVRTAGVLSHEGEGAMPEAQMALEQLGLDIGQHISRPLRPEEHRNAELLLAIDRGTGLVLFAEFAQDPRVTCLPVLADMPDVLDPHRMPLGVWVTALRQLNDQVSAAAPHIRARLGMADQSEQPPPADDRAPGPSAINQQPLIIGAGHKMQWNRDEDMQRLLQLINGQPQEQSTATLQTTADASAQPKVDTTQEAEAASAFKSIDSQPPIQTTQEQAAAADGTLVGWATQLNIAANDSPLNESVPVDAPATVGPPTDPVDRNGHVARMLKLLRTAEEMPEIVDWGRLREELVRRLRAVAEHTAGSQDFTPAATLMIEGKLAQLRAQPHSDAIVMLCQSIKRLNGPVNASLLATIGSELAQW